MSNLFEIMHGWTADNWSAAASLATFGVALLALALSTIPIRQARLAREEQAQPYVVAYMEPSGIDPQIIDLVVKNFGATAALDIVPDVEPKLTRSKENGSGGDDMRIFDCLPILVPKQEWRTFFDFAPARKGADLPSRYEITLKYRDSRRRKMESTRSVLDWDMYSARMWADVYTVHHVAKALREIEKHTKQWREGIHGGLKVFVRNGDAKDERERQQIEQMRAERAAQQQSPSEQAGGAEPEPGDSNAA